MSKLNDFYQGAKRNVGKIIAGGLVLAAGFGIRSCAKNMGEVVYSGNIDGYSVVYEEDRFTLETVSSSNNQKNRMIAQRGDITYIFEDVVDETNIDWENQKKPDLERNILERVVIRNKDSSEEYLNPWDNKQRNTIDTSTLQGQKAQEVFNKASSLYNSLRTKIREELQKKYEAEQKPFVNSFQE